MARRDTPLYRDTDDKAIAGVCAGLARYFDVDPVLVRVAFVALCVFGGAPLLAYLLLWWLADPAPHGHWDAADPAPPPASPGDSFAPPTDRAA